MDLRTDAFFKAGVYIVISPSSAASVDFAVVALCEVVRGEVGSEGVVEGEEGEGFKSVAEPLLEPPPATSSLAFRPEEAWELDWRAFFLERFFLRGGDVASLVTAAASESSSSSWPNISSIVLRLRAEEGEVCSAREEGSALRCFLFKGRLLLPLFRLLFILGEAGLDVSLDGNTSMDGEVDKADISSFVALSLTSGAHLVLLSGIGDFLGEVEWIKASSSVVGATVALWSELFDEADVVDVERLAVFTAKRLLIAPSPETAAPTIPCSVPLFPPSRPVPTPRLDRR